MISFLFFGQWFLTIIFETHVSFFNSQIVKHIFTKAEYHQYYMYTVLCNCRGFLEVRNAFLFLVKDIFKHSDSEPLSYMYMYVALSWCTQPCLHWQFPVLSKIVFTKLLYMYTDVHVVLFPSGLFISVTTDGQSHHVQIGNLTAYCTCTRTVCKFHVLSC